MASALSEKLSGLVKKISGQARITESNITDMLREVRLALLEADVALPVVRDFMARVKEQALGQEVLGSLTPGQALVGIVQRELAATMGEAVHVGRHRAVENRHRPSRRRMVPQCQRPSTDRNRPRRPGSRETALF